MSNDKVVKKEVIKRVKTVKVKITTPFRYGKKEHSGITRLPIDVANWMVNKRFGKRL